MEWYHWLIIIILAIFLELVGDWLREKIDNISDYKKQEHKIANPLPDIPIEERIAQVKYDSLKWYRISLFKLYYSKDDTNRLLFLKHKDHVTVIKQRLDLFDEEELADGICTTYGVWFEVDSFQHFYDSEETALKEWQKEIERDGYQEDPLPWNI